MFQTTNQVDLLEINGLVSFPGIFYRKTQSHTIPKFTGKVDGFRFRFFPTGPTVDQSMLELVETHGDKDLEAASIKVLQDLSVVMSHEI